MEFSEILRRRRMVRAFRSDPVDPAAIERIVAAARRAPTAGNSQGVHLIVVTDPAVRSAVADLIDEARYVARGFPPWVSAAPLHVFVCARRGDYDARYAERDKDAVRAEWDVPYWLVDAGAALMAMLLAAVDEGLAAGFLGEHRLRGVGDLLRIPEDVTLIGMVTIGTPAPDRPSPSLARGVRPNSEVVHRERW